MGELCSNVRVELLQAGHCPHDEAPEAVNRALLQFMAQDVMAAVGQAQQPAAVL
jgi:pimeloyl-ACP methyl ester carboxylesterase